MTRIESPAAVDTETPKGLPPLHATAPAWATSLVREQPELWCHVSEQVPDADVLPGDALESAVTAAYGRLSEALASAGRHPVRFWNFIPHIHADAGRGLDRYMAFNAGRFRAFCDWFGSAATFNRNVPTASAVGTRGGALVIHGLGYVDAGSPVENPRQVPAYSYSRRYGPLPPCFARATRLASPGGTRLLVGGTASIVGEDSRHDRDVRRQVLETFENLERLLERAGAAADTDARPLEAFSDLRVYIVREEDGAAVRPLVLEKFPRATVELARADLCRAELLVEIEGVAHL